MEQVDGLDFFRTQWKARRISRVPLLQEIALMHATSTRLDEVILEVRPDVLHAHSPVLNALPALQAGRRHGIPILYEVRAFWEDAAVDHGTSSEWGLRYRLTRVLETYAMRRADHVTTICEGLRKEIIGRGISAEKVTVIPNAVDPNAFPFDVKPDLPLRRSLGVDGATLVGFVGSLYAYEGLDLLIEALPGVLSVRPDVKVILVGGGPHEGALRRQVAARGLENHVTFAGRVPHEEVPRYYSIIDVLAYPRRSMRLTELVTPLKPLEAMAQGKALVASDVGGHKELIRDGETGLLFRAGSVASLEETLVALLGDRERQAHLRAAGRRYIEGERTWATSIDRYRPVYRLLAPGAV